MKVLSKVLSVLTIVLGVASLALFFFSFGKVIMGDTEVVRAGTEFAFGSAYEGIKTGKSSDLLFCIILSAFTVLFGALSLKYRKCGWATIGFALVDAIYMLVVASSSANKFIDAQGYAGASAVEYVNSMPLIISLALFATLISAVASILVADRVAVDEANEGLTIPKRFVKFIRDYIGEIKKIVWPGPKSVLKNTLIVIIMCLVVGAFIWLVDFGLGSLLNVILK